jgi:hypothetical protein
MRIIFLLITFLSFSISFSQTTEQEYQEEYEKRIQLEFINGKYIPTDLDDCFKELLRISDPKGIEIFKSGEEELVSRKLHFGLGRWMISNWSFYEGSRLSHYLKNLGIHHPDDMAQFIIVSFHRHLNGKELRIEDRVQVYQEKRLKEQEERMKIKKDTLSSQ